MSVLLDENISYRILKILELAFPKSVHVTQQGLSIMNDWEIFIYVCQGA